jgi:hypothetical protein
MQLLDFISHADVFVACVHHILDPTNAMQKNTIPTTTNVEAHKFHAQFL